MLNKEKDQQADTKSTNHSQQILLSHFLTKFLNYASYSIPVIPKKHHFVV